MILNASNLSLVNSQENARITADSPSGSSTITVDNISGFSVGKYILLGNFGESNAEIIRIHASSAPSGSTITLASNTVKDHFSDTKVTVIDYNQVEFSRSTTVSGSKSVLTTKDISADRTDTSYTDLTNSTGYAFFRFKNSSDTTYSAYSDAVPYAISSTATVQKIILKACNDTGVNVGGQFSTEQMLLDDANDCRDAICDFDWKFEITSNSTSLSCVSYENTYSLDSLTYEMKYPGIVQGVKNLKIGNYDIRYVDNDEMNLSYQASASTTLASQASANATSITLTDSHEFPDSGTVYAGGFSISYTANDKTTGVLSGISSSTITSTIAAGSNVWWNVQPGIPSKYTITVDNNILFDRPVDSTFSGYPIKIEYLRKLPIFTSFASQIEIPFDDIMTSFVKSKIEERKRNKDVAKSYMDQFNQGLSLKLGMYKLPVFESTSYYNFFDSGNSTSQNSDRRVW